MKMTNRLRKISMISFVTAAMLLLMLFLFYTSPMPKYEVKHINFPFASSPGRIAEGKRMALTICIRCHYNNATGTLAGKQHGNPKKLGDFYSGNITKDSVSGIGRWSNGDLLYFLRSGIKTNGEYVFDMPHYPGLSDEDLVSIIAFLKSDDSLVRATSFQNPKPEFSSLTKLLAWCVFRPSIYPEKKILPPDTNNVAEFGKYLATSKFSCFVCHSANTVTNNYDEPEKSWGFFKGGNPQVNEDREKIYSPNITGDTTKGIGRWSETDFLRTVKNGIKPDGTTVRDPMFPFYLLTDKEAKAIYAYLETLR